MRRGKTPREGRSTPKRSSRSKQQTKSQASKLRRPQAEPSPALRSAVVGPKMTKQAQMIAMLRQEPGVSIAGIAAVTGWQKHSVRGFFAAIVRKRFGFDLAWRKSEGGERLYRIELLAGGKCEAAGDRVA